MFGKMDEFLTRRAVAHRAVIRGNATLLLPKSARRNCGLPHPGLLDAL